MNVAFIVISILNGYKNIEMVFSNKESAEKFKEEMKAQRVYSRHEFYVLEYLRHE